MLNVVMEEPRLVFNKTTPSRACEWVQGEQRSFS